MLRMVTKFLASFILHLLTSLSISETVKLSQRGFIYNDKENRDFADPHWTGRNIQMFIIFIKKNNPNVSGERVI